MQSTMMQKQCAAGRVGARRGPLSVRASSTAVTQVQHSLSICYTCLCKKSLEII